MGGTATAFEEVESAAASTTDAGSASTTTDTTAGTTTASGSTATATTTGAGDGTASTATITDTQAVEQLKALTDRGVTLENIDALLESKTTLQNLSYLLNTNPKLVFEEIEKANPAAAAKIFDVASSMYLDRLPPDKKATGTQAQSSTGADAELRERIDKLETTIKEQNQANANRDAQARRASTEKAYKDHMGSLLDQEPVKKMQLSKVEERFVKLSVNQAIGEDPAALKRINSGVFADVGQQLKKALEEVAAERKKSNGTEIAARETVGKNGSVGAEVSAGATAVNGVVSQPEDSWEATEQAFGNALAKAKKAS